MKIKIIGSSLAYWLGERIKENVPPFELNLGLQGDSVDVKGISGAGFIKLYNSLPLILPEPVDLLVILAGGNDICNFADTNVIFQGYEKLMNHVLSSALAKHVLMLGILPRNAPRGISVHEYNVRAWELNKKLEIALAQRHDATFWKLRGFWNPQEKTSVDGQTVWQSLNLFRDGVHFNEVGLRRLAMGIRRAISSVQTSYLNSCRE